MPSDKQLSPEVFERLLARERNSRKEAERLLDQKSLELYDTNQRLRALADQLESRVSERTSKLETQNSLLGALLENIRVGVVFEAVDGDHELLYNHTVLKILGIEPTSLEGVREASVLLESLHGRCVDEESREQVDYLMDLSNRRVHVELSLDQGAHLEIFRVPVNVGDVYCGALWAIRDVSENKRQALEMKEARLRAESGDRAKSTFLANMSHEIRTPLNGICGMARILMNAELDSEAIEHVRGIQISADSLLHVLNDILDFSKIEAGQLDIEAVDFDVAHVLDSAFTILQMRAQDKSLRFDCVYPDAHLPILRGDSSRLNEILLNLIGNAIKFTTSGSVKLATRVVKSDEASLSLELTITDTGIGMSPEEMAHVFEPFSQADVSIGRRFGGSGLGLSICRDLIQLMGGSFSVESEPQVGSVFTVELPFAISPVEQATKALPSRAFSAYVVTQSDDFYRMCKSMLAYADVCLIRVENAASAVEFFTDERGVLLLDRSDQGRLLVEEDWDLKQSLPQGLRCVVVSEAVPSGSLDDAYYMSYPFSRYKLLKVAYSVHELQMPADIFREYDAESFHGVDLSGLRVLVAEDHIINQKVARLTIERFGATVDLAANGLEVLELVKRFEYDLILMDIRMPEMGGVEACLKVRDMGLDLPIYAFTADAMKGDRERFLQAGMNGYLSKPIAEADLVNILMRNQSGRANLTPDDLVARPSVEMSPADKLFHEAATLEVLAVEGFYALLGGHKEMAHELLQQFIEFSTEPIAAGYSAVKAGDFATARSRFHKLAGSAATICAHQVRAYFLSFERSLMEEPPNLATCAERLPAGRDALERLAAEIKTITET